jgi:hypothetical protein
MRFVESQESRGRTDSIGRMLSNLPHELRNSIPIPLTASLVQLLDIIGRLCLLALEKRGLAAIPLFPDFVA